MIKNGVIIKKSFILVFFVLAVLGLSKNLIIAEMSDWGADFYNNLNGRDLDDPILRPRSVPTIAPEQEWVGQFVCLEENSISPKDAQAAGFIQSPYPGEDKFIIDGEGWCYSTNTIGAIYNYGIFLSRHVIDYCPKGYTVGRDGSAPLSFVKGINSCCEIGHPYLYENWWNTNMICCEQPGLDLKTGAKRCNESDPGVEPTTFWRLFSFNLSPTFFEATPKYTCGIQDCFFQGDKPAEGIRRGSYTKEEIVRLGIQCYPDTSSGDYTEENPQPTFTAGNNTYYCVAGDALTKEEYESWKDQLNAYRGCKAFGDNTSEFNNCTACLKQCTGCVYSSLGCVNPSMNGIISTVMRVALGILGTVAIVRIMQAAILRQSGDPKDIQESWDIIMSVIIGAVVLVSSTLLLRVIGINVLGILPYDF